MLRLGAGYAASLLTLFMTGCGSADESAGFTVTDSLAITIATNSRVLSQIPVRLLDESPAREITGAELFAVRSLQPLGDGEIVVGASGTGSVLIYDRTGELVVRFGRTGDGPGEFRRIQSVVALPADSIGVYDSRLQRLTVISRFGDLGRVVNLADLVPSGGSSEVLRLREGLAFVGIASLSPQDTEGVYRNAAPSYRISLEGEVLAAYGEFPGLEAFSAIRMTGPVPFGATLSAATSGAQLIVGTAEQPELHVFGPGGELTRIIRWSDTDRTVDQGRMDEYIAFLLAQSTPEEVAFIGDRLAGMPFARRRPAYADILAGPDGSLWVGEYPGPEAGFPGRRGPSRRWLVLDAEGEMRERIESPEGFLPYALEADRIWGVYRDTLDVESIRAYATPGDSS